MIKATVTIPDSSALLIREIPVNATHSKGGNAPERRPEA